MWLPGGTGSLLLHCLTELGGKESSYYWIMQQTLVLEISTYTTLARGSSFAKIKETKCKIFTDLLNKAIKEKEKEGERERRECDSPSLSHCW